MNDIIRDIIGNTCALVGIILLIVGFWFPALFILAILLIWISSKLQKELPPPNICFWNALNRKLQDDPEYANYFFKRINAKEWAVFNEHKVMFEESLEANINPNL